MKRILYVDLISPAGHENFDMNMMRLMTQEYEVDAMIRESMIERIPNDYYHTITACPKEIFPDYWHTKTNSRMAALLWRKEQYRFIKYILTEMAIEYDFIFFSSVDVFSFSLASRSVKHKQFSFVDHGIYRLKNWTTRFFYRWVLRSDIKIIALEEYVKRYMCETGIHNPMSVIHHPVPSVKERQWCKMKQKDMYHIFAPSTSNDDAFIAELIEKREYIPQNISVTIKSHGFTISDNCLKVFNERILQEEYNREFNDADFILIPYEPSYNYRTSAILFEALAQGKRVLLWGNNTLKDYFSDYQNCVTLFVDVDDLIRKLSSLETLKYDDKEIDRFMNHYSDEYIINQIKQAFK